MEDVEDFGTFWYEAPATKTNGQFDCVLKKQDGYAFYEMKFYEHPMTLSECEKEEAYLKQMESGAFHCSKGAGLMAAQEALSTISTDRDL